jgi:hypothetical protein
MPNFMEIHLAILMLYMRTDGQTATSMAAPQVTICELIKVLEPG